MRRLYNKIRDVKETGGFFDSSGLSEEMKSDIIDLIDFDDLEGSAERIEMYFVKLREELKQETPY